MELVAKLTASYDLSEVCNVLISLNYLVCQVNTKECFVYAQGKTGNDLRRDLQSAKQSCGFKV